MVSGEHTIKDNITEYVAVADNLAVEFSQTVSIDLCLGNSFLSNNNVAFLYLC